MATPAEAPAAEQGTLGRAAVEHATRLYFADTPELIEIARCESRFRQYDADGNILRGEKNSRDIGVMQINEFYHLESAMKLGFDLYSLAGNMGYARYLYEKKGSQPWVSSKPCWGKRVASL
ncbi:hypothetical protein COU17_00010 [Candidatus Kaiserbacteria bacterium CG10_big_fil_rev_8_21_14_0_10_49_17]|uniref:Transglycosylase SLT domain-containing protein n=1 Tax=Candidatus Kaiserbacteria bacterium CG10_big_fil_rev_8_21_14_0_10_49_17 TaxID=1974609 RepID=A0A2M6WFF3_9BACT|nr:MAG: hypothetical protein COU17_00010 [Candidatus Kaiserbacteria bacterium CG10_big_fil_rev_8_21_14_0_10_49_17]